MWASVCVLNVHVGLSVCHHCACGVQTAGSTAGAESRGDGSRGEGSRGEGSSRAERAVSLESAASASLPATAIPQGEGCWSAFPCIVNKSAGCLVSMLAGCIVDLFAGSTVDMLASVLHNKFFDNRYGKEPHQVYLTPQAVLGLFTHQCTEAG